MAKEQFKAALKLAIDQIKNNPSLGISSEQEAEIVVNDREEADRRIKESGRTVILGEKWQTA